MVTIREQLDSYVMEKYQVEPDAPDCHSPRRKTASRRMAFSISGFRSVRAL